MADYIRKFNLATAADTPGREPVFRLLLDAGADTPNTTWVPVAGDVLVSLDYGATWNNIATLPALTAGNHAWKYVFSQAETNCRLLLVATKDQGSPVIGADFFAIETVGSASGELPGDYFSTTSMGTPISTAQAAHLDADVSANSPAAVWANSTRSLTTFGTLVSDIWANATRTLSSFGTLAADVWAASVRALTDKANFTLAGSEYTAISVAVADLNLTGHTAAGSIGRALQIARAQGKGKWVVDSIGNTLTVLDVDNTTVIAVFDLTPHAGPYASRSATPE